MGKTIEIKHENLQTNLGSFDEKLGLAKLHILLGRQAQVGRQKLDHLLTNLSIGGTATRLAGHKNFVAAVEAMKFLPVRPMEAKLTDKSQGVQGLP